METMLLTAYVLVWPLISMAVLAVIWLATRRDFSSANVRTGNWSSYTEPNRAVTG